MRIGIFGGSFDPPHRGHLRMAKAAQESLGLDEIIFLPAARNPMKPARTTASGDDRLEMVKLLIANEPAFSVSDMELTRGGMSYTVDTLGELHMVRPAEYWFLMGADALKGFGEWKNPQRILRLCRIAVAVRPPLQSADDVAARLPAEFRDKMDVVPMVGDATTSTDIRIALREGKLASDIVPANVLQYIRRKKLYTR
ncbi:nicotinate (nicotinamide) nucleotide adenylyltransferase [bacterium]|nr:MAG: nicotinate (nicotinamide) nucleotide adenylyltransferase [bacterium]